MEESETLQPQPNLPLPAPAKGVAANFVPIPRIAPPPLGREEGSIRCFLGYRFCHGSRDKNYRMLPSKMEISIHTSDTRCLIFTCKIPTNSLENLLSYGDLSPDSSRAPPEHAPPQPEVA